MKVYISTDIEGIGGVTDLDHTRRDGRDYGTARTLMTKEVNAAAEGAFNGGASEVIVNDSHGKMINLRVEDLDERIFLISGSPKPLAMVQGVKGCDCAFFVGYHSLAGTGNAVLDHTYHGRVIYNIRVNNVTMGELGINALLSGYFGVPVVLVAGDKTTTDEAVTFLKTVETVTTKEGIGRFAAKNKHPNVVRKEIKGKAQKAVETVTRFTPFTIEPPFHLEMDLMTSDMADCAVMVPGVEQVSARCVAYRCDDFLELYKMMRVIILLGSAMRKK